MSSRGSYRPGRKPGKRERQELKAGTRAPIDDKERRYKQDVERGKPTSDYYRPPSPRREERARRGESRDRRRAPSRDNRRDERRRQSPSPSRRRDERRVTESRRRSRSPERARWDDRAPSYSSRRPSRSPLRSSRQRRTPSPRRDERSSVYTSRHRSPSPSRRRQRSRSVERPRREERSSTYTDSWRPRAEERWRRRTPPPSISSSRGHYRDEPQKWRRSRSPQESGESDRRSKMSPSRRPMAPPPLPIQKQPEPQPQPLPTPEPSRGEGKVVAATTGMVLESPVSVASAIVQGLAEDEMELEISAGSPPEIGKELEQERADESEVPQFAMQLISSDGKPSNLPDSELAFEIGSEFGEVPLEEGLADSEVDEDAMFGFCDNLSEAGSLAPPPGSDHQQIGSDYPPVEDDEITARMRQRAEDDPALEEAVNLIRLGQATKEQQAYYHTAFLQSASSGLKSNEKPVGRGTQGQPKDLLGFLAEVEGVSDEETKAILQALHKDEATSPTARHILKLMGRLKDMAIDQGKRLEHVYLSIGESTLYYTDLLPLYWVKGHESAAYIGDTVFKSLLSSEIGNVPGMYFFADASVWFNDSGTTFEKLKDRIRQETREARNGSIPAYGWPMQDMQNDVECIRFPFNPSRNHWVGVEVLLQHPPQIRVYNPWKKGEAESNARARGGKSGAFKAAVESLPALFELASLRPGSPLAAFDWSATETVRADCPQQGDRNIDCGPWVIFFLTQLTHERRITTPELDTDWLRHAFGQWVRAQCVAALYNHCFGWNEDISGLGDLFNNQPTIEELLFRYPESESEPGSAADEDGEEENDGPSTTLNKPSGAGPSGADGVLDAMIKAADRGGDAELRCGPWRFVLGDDDGRIQSIIIILRWSSTPHWMNSRLSIEDVLQKIKMLANQAFRGYKRYATHDNRVESDVIVHASFQITTKWMPAFPKWMPASAKWMPASPRAKAKMVDGTQGPLLEAHCPKCDYTYQFRPTDCRVRSEPWQAHVISHALQDKDWEKIMVQSGAMWTGSCPKPGCKFATGPSPHRSVKKNLAAHCGACFAAEWLDDKNLFLCFTCNCKDPGCQRLWTHNEWSDFVQHVKLPRKGQSKCAYCGKGVVDLPRHVLISHQKDEVPQGWYRCRVPINHRVANATWCELPFSIKNTLQKQEGNDELYCAWGTADEHLQHCKRKTAFKSLQERRRHYDKSHRDHIWPLSEDISCALIYPSELELLEHHLNDHLKLGSGVRSGAIRIRERRGILFTQPITKSLLQAVGREPILLSVGIDGFTCNAPLLKEYLQRIRDTQLKLVICTTKLGALEEGHLTEAGGSYWGCYELETLISSLNDPASAPAAYRGLVEVWDRQQKMKDEESKLRVPRNRILHTVLPEDGEEAEEGDLFVTPDLSGDENDSE